ncbi:MAG: tyrosine-type recombinase/integrase [Chloroflexota bacterium]|nr:tyrosine-type recombinase/integrase [Chloroflexota bacterium]
MKTYRQVLGAFAAWVEGRTGQGFASGSVTRQLIKGWQRHLVSERNLDDATYTKYISALRSFLAWLHEEGGTELTRDDAKLPKSHLDLSSVKALAPEEVGSLLSQPDPETPWGRRDRALLALLYCSGMRVAELCALDRSQVPLERLGEAPVLELPIVGKGRKPRVVFVDELAQELLREYLSSRADELPALFRPYKGPPGQGRLTPRAIQGAIRRYSRAAGLMSAPTPHTLRHTFAVHKLQAGADTRIVQAFLGHSSLATTQRYTRVTDRYLRESYERSHTPARV